MSGSRRRNKHQTQQQPSTAAPIPQIVASQDGQDESDSSQPPGRPVEGIVARRRGKVKEELALTLLNAAARVGRIGVGVTAAVIVAIIVSAGLAILLAIHHQLFIFLKALFIHEGNEKPDSELVSYFANAEKATVIVVCCILVVGVLRIAWGEFTEFGPKGESE